MEFYTETERCVNKMDEKVLNLLKENIGNFEEEMANHKLRLEQKEYFLVVAGIGGSSLDVVLTLKQGSYMSILTLQSTLNHKLLIVSYLEMSQ